ncbi:hypothetical protein CKO28_20280 [Rhodovibrio sodomensis]|uniref:DAGKc domain-containing protein n=2 Tax=Rhodovibrio sodomensis TaxID=1088 RepID=A0ABS1DIQ5_9PROT|nr:hypothetical protein [Rhodovibrio sodomensis]
MDTCLRYHPSSPDRASGAGERPWTASRILAQGASMSDIAVLSNPASGNNRTRARRDLQALTRSRGIDHLQPARLREVPNALRTLAARNTRVLAIDGGDGTVVAVVTALRRHKPFTREPILAVLSGGSTNMIARDAGCPGAPAAALARLLKHWDTADGQLPIVTRRPLLVRSAGAPPSYGFFLGGVGIPRVTAAARRGLYARGIAGPLAWSLALIWSLWRLACGGLKTTPLLRPADVRIACNDSPGATAPRIAVIVTSLDRLLLGLRPVSPGEGVGVAVINAHVPGLWRRAPSALWRPWPSFTAIEAKPFAACRCRSVALSATEDWVLDGEPLDSPADATLTVQSDSSLRFVMA